MNDMTKEEFFEGLEMFYAAGIQLVRRKNADYSPGESPFQNFYVAEKLGVTDAKRALLVRMCDKVARTASLLKNDAQVADESLTDTLLDLANYSAILALLIKDEARKKLPE